MTNGIPVYVAFDGEGFTGRFDRSSKAVVDVAKLHPTDRSEQIRGLDHPHVAVIKDCQDFSVSSFQHLFDTDLANWCAENYATGFGGVVAASEAIVQIALELVNPFPESVRLVYELENHLYFATVHQKRRISLIRMAAIESEQGWEPLLKRSDLWLRQNKIAIPGDTFWIGSFSVAPTPQGTHLCVGIASESIAAAGSVLVEPSSVSHQPRRLIQMIRRFRKVSLIGSGTAALVTVALGILFWIQAQGMEKSIAKTGGSTQLTAVEQKFCDSLSREVSRRMDLDSQLSKTIQWSGILTNLAVIPHENVAIQRLGSRLTETGVELAFEGDGSSEQAVTSFIAALKESTRFTSIQLNQFDRTERGGYRFRVQCIAK